MSKEHFCFTSPLGPLMEEYLSVKRHQNVGIKAILTVFVELDRMPMVRRTIQISDVKAWGLNVNNGFMNQQLIGLCPCLFKV